MELFGLPTLADPFLAECLMAVGPTGQGFMGPVHVPPERLYSWCKLTAFELGPWQAEAVLAASKAYASQLSREDKLPPWASEDMTQAKMAKIMREARSKKALEKNG